MSERQILISRRDFLRVATTVPATVYMATRSQEQPPTPENFVIGPNTKRVLNLTWDQPTGFGTAQLTAFTDPFNPRYTNIVYKRTGATQQEIGDYASRVRRDGMLVPLNPEDLQATSAIIEAHCLDGGGPIKLRMGDTGGSKGFEAILRQKEQDNTNPLLEGRNSLVVTADPASYLQHDSDAVIETMPDETIIRGAREKGIILSVTLPGQLITPPEGGFDEVLLTCPTTKDIVPLVNVALGKVSPAGKVVVTIAPFDGDPKAAQLESFLKEEKRIYERHKFTQKELQSKPLAFLVGAHDSEFIPSRGVAGYDTTRVNTFIIYGPDNKDSKIEDFLQENREIEEAKANLLKLGLTAGVGAGALAGLRAWAKRKHDSMLVGTLPPKERR